MNNEKIKLFKLLLKTFYKLNIKYYNNNIHK